MQTLHLVLGEAETRAKMQVHMRMRSNSFIQDSPVERAAGVWGEMLAGRFHKTLRNLKGSRAFRHRSRADACIMNVGRHIEAMRPNKHLIMCCENKQKTSAQSTTKCSMVQAKRSMALCYVVGDFVSLLIIVRSMLHPG